MILLAMVLFAQTVAQPVPVISPVALNQFQLGAGSKFDIAPDGSPVISTGAGSTASVDLGVTPAQLQAYPPGQAPYVREGTYVLTFDVLNYFPKYPADLYFEVDFGTQELCEGHIWGKLNWTTVTATCPGPGYIVIDQALPDGGPVQGAKDLVITITTKQWILLTKNYSLTFTPSN